MYLDSNCSRKNCLHLVESQKKAPSLKKKSLKLTVFSKRNWPIFQVLHSVDGKCKLLLAML